MFAMTCIVRNNLHRVRFLALLLRFETGQDAVHEETPLCTFSKNVRDLRPIALPGRATPTYWRAHTRRRFRLQLLQQGSGVPARAAASVVEYVPRSRGFRS